MIKFIVTLKCLLEQNKKKVYQTIHYIVRDQKFVLQRKVLKNCEACPNVTRKVNQNMIQDCVKESRLTQLTQDVRNNWDTTYSVNVFSPVQAFDSDKINATKNRHIPSVMFQCVPLIAELVKYFQDKYTHLEVHSVWLIEKLRENNGFQGWHRDFYPGIEVTMTIVVNIGTVMKN